LIATLLKQQWYEEARRWNRILIKHDDKPSKAWKTWPIPKHLGKNPDVVGTQLIAADSIFSDNPIPSGATTSALPFDRADMSVALGKHLGMGPKEMSDEFCARIFATKAFSLDTIIKGLSLISTTRIGPLAFREMAIRAGAPIVPMTISGTREMMPKGESAIRPGIVRVVVHQPISTEGMSEDERGALADRTREMIASAL